MNSRNRLLADAWLNSPYKRRHDLLMANTMLAVALPLGSLAALATRLDKPRLPITFRQQRVGKHAKPFEVFKIRSLNTVDNKPGSSGYSDARATTVGKILRVLSLDETPQLLNVLRGEMSFVGPRPLMEADIENMREELSMSEFNDWWHAYTACKPGMVSKFSVLTHRPEPLVPKTFYSRAELDIQYWRTASYETDTDITRQALAKAPMLTREATRIALANFSINQS